MTKPAATAAPAPAGKKKSPGGRTRGSKALTVSQKAEAATLWRMGDVTLDDLAKKFGKRPETFSRLFKRMGIEKGSAAKETIAAANAKATARVMSDTEEQVTKILATKDSHFRMQDALAKVVWAEIVRCRQAGLDLAKLKDLMTTLKLAGEIIGNSRKEIYTILGVEEHDNKKELEDLPELTVRELSRVEMEQLQQAPIEDLDLEDDLGADMLEDDDLDEDPLA